MTRQLIFVCTGNICRSPMAERMAERALADAGIDDLEVTSAGTSAEETGNPIDSRAARVLEGLGCRTDDHRAHRMTADELGSADLIVCMETHHRDRVIRVAPDVEDRTVLLTDFVPDAEPGSGVPDPWYGDATGFDDTAATITAALPGLVDRLRG